MIVIGYYICKFSDCPSYLGMKSDHFISASECLSDHEPQLFLCHGWTPNGDDETYIRYFPTREIYLKMSGEINELFRKKMFFEDGRFLRKEDALYFYHKYYDDSDHMLISVSTLPAYRSSLGNAIISEDQDEEGEYLGNDLIGWEFSGFHSFLCNSLQEEFPQIEFNNYGLINDAFEVVIKMAEQIQGMGEPVDWIPVKIHRL